MSTLHAGQNIARMLFLGGELALRLIFRDPPDVKLRDTLVANPAEWRGDAISGAPTGTMPPATRPARSPVTGLAPTRRRRCQHRTCCASGARASHRAPRRPRGASRSMSRMHRHSIPRVPRGPRSQRSSAFEVRGLTNAFSGRHETMGESQARVRASGEARPRMRPARRSRRPSSYARQSRFLGTSRRLRLLQRPRPPQRASSRRRWR